MKKFIFLFIGCFNFLIAFSQIDSSGQSNQNAPARLYLITVINSYEPTIGSDCVTDGNRIETFFLAIASVLQLEFYKTKLADNAFSKQSVTKAIESLKISKNDVVVFYYSGHGFRYKNDDEYLFPQLDLRRNPVNDNIRDSAGLQDFWNTLNNATLNIEKIFNHLKRQGKFTLVLSDCCNSTVDIKRPKINERDFVNSRGLTSRSDKNWDTAACRKLFLEAKTDYLISAAQRGEYAISTSSKGGLFTYSFNDVMRNYLYTKNKNPNPSWEEIITQTAGKTLLFSMNSSTEKKLKKQTVISAKQ